MTEQPTSLFLADALEVRGFLGTTASDAATELRRLHAVNQELLSALKAMLTHMGMDEDEWNKPTFAQARAIIAKAEGT